MVYGFVIIVDPWDTLPLSPPLPRVPISTNARFSFPALARSRIFDSVVLGNSSARLLEPRLLNAGFGARFANLAMNSATAYEQSRMLQVFLRAHPRPLAVMFGLDQEWCSPSFRRYTERPFPEWMYTDNLWPAYRYMLTPYAVQEAANQFAVMLHLKWRRYGLDGYTSFVPPESAYDRVRRDAAFLRWPPTDRSPPPPDARAVFPALSLLRQDLFSLPPETRKVLFFVPYYIERQGEAGSVTAWNWAQCKQQVAAVAAETGAEAIDFMIPSAITRDKDNYWDPVHYRVPIA
ncbi:MAG: hypothetical protein JOZ05_24915, partial [Acetobacteraceae bacterium]|nr:hypothetical protein [Acetobacteraceae bacterium]